MQSSSSLSVHVNLACWWWWSWSKRGKRTKSLHRHPYRFSCPFSLIDGNFFNLVPADLNDFPFVIIMLMASFLHFLLWMKGERRRLRGGLSPSQLVYVSVIHKHESDTKKRAEKRFFMRVFAWCVCSPTAGCLKSESREKEERWRWAGQVCEH